MTRRSALGVVAVAAATTAALTLPGAIGPAFAQEPGYPSWDDVERARNNESLKASEISRVQNLIASLQQRVAETQAASERAATAFYDAQQAFFEASFRADELQNQADEKAKLAKDASNKAAQVANQLYRNGGDDASLELFFSGSAQNADDLLSRLGNLDRLLQHNSTIYTDAVAARDSAQSLSDQAAVARKERDRLQKVAEQKMVEAQNAAVAAESALQAQNEHIVVLQAQLSALRDTSAKTLADYKAGVEAERKRKERERKEREERERRERERREREERERREREERERKEREEREKNNNNSGGGGGGGGSKPSTGGGGGSKPSGGSNGWVRPNNGVRTSGFGYRTQICGPSYCSSSLHAGVDLASWCGSAIYAAHSGTVDYAGRNGGYGNYIRIQHGGGIGTGYAHIQNGGILVRPGQHVKAGQMIALEGNTGNSFGCHLHFEVYVNGSPVNPAPFMAARGISV